MRSDGGEVPVLDLPSGDRREEIHLRRAILAAPADADQLYQVGRVYFQRALYDAAFACWKRSLVQNTKWWETIGRWAATRLSPDELIRRVLPPHPEVLLRVAETIYGRPEFSSARRQLASRALRVVSQASWLSADERRRYSAEAQEMIAACDRESGVSYNARSAGPSGPRDAGADSAGRVDPFNSSLRRPREPATERASNEG